MGLNAKFKASSVDPTCLCGLTVIVPLFKITFLALSVAESHTILFCDCLLLCKGYLLRCASTALLQRSRTKTDEKYRELL